VSSKVHFVHIASQLRGLKSPYLWSAMKTFEDLETGNKAKARDCCSTATDRRLFLRFSRSQRVKEREAPENFVTRLVASAFFLGHVLQYDQMRCRFSSWRAPTGCNSIYGCR
jgi:hypothetical protein